MECHRSTSGHVITRIPIQRDQPQDRFPGPGFDLAPHLQLQNDRRHEAVQNSRIESTTDRVYSMWPPASDYTRNITQTFDVYKPYVAIQNRLRPIIVQPSRNLPLVAEKCVSRPSGVRRAQRQCSTFEIWRHRHQIPGESRIQRTSRYTPSRCRRSTPNHRVDVFEAQIRPGTRAFGRIERCERL